MKPSSGGDGPGTAAAGRLVAPDRQWQPDLYLRYAAYRERPAHDLLAQVPDLPDDLARGLVVDLGCGPGNVTPHLAARFPRARLLGVDNAPAMLARARQLDLAATWQEADAATWTFKIRKGVTFHNGKDVTPDDIVANLNPQQSNISLRVGWHRNHD